MSAASGPATGGSHCDCPVAVSKEIVRKCLEIDTVTALTDEQISLVSRVPSFELDDILPGREFKGSTHHSAVHPGGNCCAGEDIASNTRCSVQTDGRDRQDKLIHGAQVPRHLHRVEYVVFCDCEGTIVEQKLLVEVEKQKRAEDDVDATWSFSGEMRVSRTPSATTCANV